jgi:GNAT superfamily N-acetyltransferase
LADWALDRLSSLRAIAAFWSVYVVVFALLRLGRSSFLSFDDAISAEVMQRTLLPAYSARNPPLYEWCLWAVQQVFGAGVHSHVILRAVLLVAIGTAMFETVRGLSRDARLAAAASLSLLGFYAFTWQVHAALTQSLFVFLLLLVLIRLMDSFCRKPSVGRALGLGLTMGLGILGKWSFALPAGAALIVLLLDPRARRAGIGYFALMAAACGVTLLPTLLYLMQVQADLADASSRILFYKAAETHLGRVLQGLTGVLVKTAAFFLPFLLFVIAAYARLRVWPRHTRGDASAQLVSRFVAVQALILLAAVLFAGISNVTERYVYTLAVPMVIAFFLSLAVPPVRETVLRFVVNGAFLSTAVVVAIKLGLVVEALLPNGRVVRDVLPFPALARELEARGYGQAAIVIPDRPLSGNLVELMPKAEIVTESSSRLLPPGTYRPDQTCLLLWQAERYGSSMRTTFEIITPPPDLPLETLTITGSNGGIGAPRTGVFKYVDLGKDAELCRTWVGVR